MKLPVVLQALGLVGLPIAALIAWGVAPAIGIGSVSLLVAGTVLEVERQPGDG